MMAPGETSGSLVPTDEQRAIIDHPLEPLRVAAGAGTGKTTTIVERLAGFVDGGLAPESALGITFTNKAAEELADRLRERLRSHAVEGREVEVTTYHGFAYRILDELGAAVGVERGTPVMGPGYVRQLLHESIGGGPYEHLDLTALAWRVDEAATLGAQLAGNLAEPEDIEALAPSTPDDTWSARTELTRLLVAYRETKTRLGVIDYGDLVRLAHRLLTTRPRLARRIRSRYRLVVIDEYQDTDPGQRELLRSVFGGGFPITAVGDPDQTIYEWRGASAANFGSFGTHFPVGERPAPTRRLTLNRRSGPAILGLANRVRALIHGTAPADPLRPATGDDDHLATGWFRTAEEEATWVAGEIRRLHDEEGLPWRDIGVLFRKNRQMAIVRDALQDQDVPVEVASLGGLLDVPEVADVHAWLRALGRPDDSVAVARILLGSRYRLGLGDLAPLARWSRRRHRSPGEQPGADILPYSLIEAVDRLPEVEGIEDEARDRLHEFRARYRTLLAEAQGVTLVELVRRIIDTIDGWTEIEAMPYPHGLSARLNLYRFIDLVEDWSPLAGRPSLDGFLGYLDLLQEERAPEELDTARVGDEDAVSMLTVHRAKGLEWEAVFLPAVSHDAFPARSQGFDDPHRHPRWLPYELRLDPETLPPPETTGEARRDMLRDRHRTQELRTAYVAVTRARRRLTVTGAAWTGGKRARKPGELLETVASCQDVDTITWVDDPGPPPVDRPTTDGAPDPTFTGGWREALRRRLDDPGWIDEHPDAGSTFETHRDQLTLELDRLPEPVEVRSTVVEPAVSVSALVALAGCPARYRWAHVDRLPRRPAPSLRKGSEIHRRIELHHRGATPFAAMEPATAPRDGDPGSGSRVDPYREFLASRFAGSPARHLETPFEMIIAGVRVRGRIDAVFEHEPGWWEIVDYKTGRPSDDPAALVQLQAYAVATADGALPGSAPDRVQVTFANLGTSPVTEQTVEVTTEWLDEARHRLAELVGETGAGEHPPRPSARCRRCDFVGLCPAGRRWVTENPEPAR